MLTSSRSLSGSVSILFLLLFSSLISGKVSTPHGWVDVSKVSFAPPNPTCKQARRAGEAEEKETKQAAGVAGTKGPPGLAALFAKGPPGKGRGAGKPGGLGDLFAGGAKPNPGGLKGGSG